MNLWIWISVQCSALLPSLSVSSETDDFYEPDQTEDNPTCRIGYFMCNDKQLCIAQRLNCNSEGDCYDGSDESNCSDVSATLFWDSLFRKNINALTDDIPWGKCGKFRTESRQIMRRKGQISEGLCFISLDFNLSEYPILNSTCRCKVREIHCQFKNLVNIPTTLPEKGLSVLDLSGNHFPMLNNLFLASVPSAQKL